MSAAVSNVLKMEGNFSPFDWSGSTIYSAAFVGQGTDAAFFSQLHADQIRAEINLRGVLRHVWQVDEISVQRAELNLVGPKIPVQTRDSAAGVSRSPSFLPKRVEITRAIIQETNVTWNGGGLAGVALTLMPQNDSWQITGDGGRCVQQGWPSFAIDHFKMRYRHPSLFVTAAELKTDDAGTIQLDGEIASTQSYQFHTKLDGVPITPLLREDWRARLKGKLAGDVNVRSGSVGAPQIDGKLSMSAGQLEALPVLDQIAIFTRTEQFRTLALHKASANFVQDGGKLTVTQFAAESEGLLRIEGDFFVESGTIDGTFQVGLTPASLQWLPGSEAKVFTVARGGYLWTPMKVSGPLEHPREDLSERLVAAAQDTLIEGVGNAVEKTKRDIQDILSPLTH
ncbi:MAG: hypothetical protein M3O82_05555 [Verrucomicrobiota bacterium]|nr:hypothetical protein [Verrucomicrobiota bacterium]